MQLLHRNINKSSVDMKQKVIVGKPDVDVEMTEDSWMKICMTFVKAKLMFI